MRTPSARRSKATAADAVLPLLPFARRDLEDGQSWPVAKTDANGGIRGPASTRPGSGVVLRIIFFGSGGEGSMVPLETISRSHQVIALVRPFRSRSWWRRMASSIKSRTGIGMQAAMAKRSEEHTSELQSQSNLVCRLLLEK